MFALKRDASTKVIYDALTKPIRNIHSNYNGHCALSLGAGHANRFLIKVIDRLKKSEKEDVIKLFAAYRVPFGKNKGDSLYALAVKGGCVDHLDVLKRIGVPTTCDIPGRTYYEVAVDSYLEFSRDPNYGNQSRQAFLVFEMMDALAPEGTDMDEEEARLEKILSETGHGNSRKKRKHKAIEAKESKESKVAEESKESPIAESAEASSGSSSEHPSKKIKLEVDKKENGKDEKKEDSLASMSMPEESAEVATKEKNGKDEKAGNSSALVSSPNKAEEVTPFELPPAALASAAYAGDAVMADASVIPPASLPAPRMIDLQSPSASRVVPPTYASLIQAVPLSQLFIYKSLNVSPPRQNAATPAPQTPTFMPVPALRATGFSDLFQPLQAARPITLPTPASLGIPPAKKR